jgi:uncharacterized protein (DUF488 family)
MYFRYMLYTIGYSGFSPEEFLNALRSRGVEVLVDVRRRLGREGARRRLCRVEDL